MGGAKPPRCPRLQVWVPVSAGFSRPGFERRAHFLNRCWFTDVRFEHRTQKFERKYFHIFKYFVKALDFFSFQ
jgi:hypothetical protein